MFPCYGHTDSQVQMLRGWAGSVTSHAATSAVLSGGVQEDGDSAYLLQFSNFDIDVQFYINIHNRLDKAPMKFLEICKVLNH